MELRVLQYFLAVAREENISRAAETLHLSQPTLSRQLKDMEEELGKQLLIRGSHSVSLTEEGMILRKRAEEIMELVRRAEDEIALADEEVAGEVCFAVGETEGIRIFARLIEKMKREYPRITYRFSSGNSVFVREQLDRGLADFGLLYGTADSGGYDSLNIPITDRWGALMRKDSPLAGKEVIRPEDLAGEPVILPHQTTSRSQVMEWLGEYRESVRVIASYNLAMNASILAAEGVGCALCFDGLFNVTGDSPLCFRPLSPILESRAVFLWKKYRPLGKAPKKFLELLQESGLQ